MYTKKKLLLCRAVKKLNEMKYVSLTHNRHSIFLIFFNFQSTESKSGSVTYMRDGSGNNEILYILILLEEIKYTYAKLFTVTY